MRGEIMISGTIKLRFWHITESRDELMSLCCENGIKCDHVTAVKSDKRACEMLAVLLLVHDFNKKWELAHNEDGAPSIRNQKGPFISITHSENVVCVATSPLPFGIDIEMNSEKILRVRKKFLNEEELLYFPEDNALHHMMAWTAKEAVYKAFSTKGLDFRNNIRLTPELHRGVVEHDGEITRYHISRLWYGKHDFLITIATLDIT